WSLTVCGRPHRGPSGEPTFRLRAGRVGPRSGDFLSICNKGDADGQETTGEQAVSRGFAVPHSTVGAQRRAPGASVGHWLAVDGPSGLDRAARSGHAAIRARPDTLRRAVGAREGEPVADRAPREVPGWGRCPVDR